jgi:ribonuclease E
MEQSSSTQTESSPGFPMGLGGRSASMPLSQIVRSFRDGNAGRRPRPQNNNRERQASVDTRVASTEVVATTISSEIIETKPVPAPELPKVAFTPLQEEPLKDVVQTAGMIWVGTDRDKLAEVQTQIQAESPAPKVPREPKQPANVPNGPMVLVETGGQEKTIDKTI